MKLMDLYHLMNTGEITDEEAARVLGFTVTGLKSRKTKWGPRLPLLLSVLDGIGEGKMEISEASKIMGVTVRNMRLVAGSWKVERPIKGYVIKKAATKVKWELLKKYAIDVIADGATLEEAATATELTDRQVRRWVAKLIDKHFGITWKDLMKMPLSKRQRLADKIEEAEGLEIAKQQVLKAISDGKKTIQQEAVDRVMGKHVRRYSPPKRMNDVPGRRPSNRA